MNNQPATCPECGSGEIHLRKSRGDWTCDVCLHAWIPADRAERSADVMLDPKPRLFLSYGRRDAEKLSERLEADLTAQGYQVWHDRRKIRSGREWEQEIQDGLRSTQLVVALLTPHAVRRSGDPNNPDDADSVCIDELSFARFACKTPIVPVMAIPCEPPFVIFRLDYVDLLAWQDSDNQYQAGFRRLLEAIDAGLRGEVRYRTWDDRLGSWDFAAFLHEKRRDFCGRQWFFDQVDDWRHCRNERALLITGDPGVGKSAIVAELVHRNPDGQVLAYHCCQTTSPETLRPDRFVRSLAAMIASKLPAYAALLDDPKVEEALSEGRCRQDPLSAFEAGILTPLETLHAPPDGVHYLLIDALDEGLLHPESLTIVDVLASRLNRLPGWLRLVATTRKEHDVLDRLRGLRAFALDAQDPRNLDDIERLLAHRLGQPELHARLDRSGVAAIEAIRRLRDKSEGNFLWVQQALEGIERDQYAFERLDELPPGLHGLYFDFFRRQFPDEVTYAPVRRVLQVIVGAAESLTEDDLARATGLDPEDELPRLLRVLSSYLRERQDRYELYHKSLADWLTARDNRGALYYASPKRGHERLADWCWSEFQPDPRSMSSYALAHLPTHLVECARWDDLSSVMCDLSFLESKAESGHVFDLATDFRLAVERIPADHSQLRILRLLGQALRYDIHFLARHPTTLFQCLWNRCWWYDCLEAAAHYDPPPAGWPHEGLPWTRSEAERLSILMESWRAAKEGRTPGFVGVRALSPLEPSLGSPQLACFRSHEDEVMSVAYDREGRRIVSGSMDKTIRIWDAKTGADVACLRGHELTVSCIALSPDDRHIASGSYDKTVRIWEAESGRELARFTGRDGVKSIAYSPDGHRIAWCGGMSDRTVRVWDSTSGTEPACLREHDGDVMSVAWSPDGRRLASGSRDKTVRVWDTDDGTELACLRGHEGDVISVAWSPDGRRLASGSWDETVRIWDAEDGTELACLRGHQHFIESVAWSPNGRQLASGGDQYDKTLRIWDTETRVERVSFGGHEGAVHGVTWSPDGRQIASASSDKTVRVWDAEALAEAPRAVGHKKQVNSLAWFREGQRLVSGSEDGMLRIWDIKANLERARLRGRVGAITSATVSPDGRRLAGGLWDGTIQLWDVASCTELVWIFGHRGAVTSLVFSPDGIRLASGSWDQTVRVWDAATGAELACLRGHEGWVTSVAFSPDGRRIASGSNDTVRIWDAKSGAELACFRGCEYSVTSVAFSPDNRRVASGSWAGPVRVWDIDTGECIEVILGSGDVESIAEGTARFPLRAMRRGLETVIERAANGQAIAWFPVALGHITTHPSGRIWAGSVANHVYLVQLEGHVDGGRAMGDGR